MSKAKQAKKIAKKVVRREGRKLPVHGADNEAPDAPDTSAEDAAVNQAQESELAGNNPTGVITDGLEGAGGNVEV